MARVFSGCTLIARHKPWRFSQEERSLPDKKNSPVVGASYNGVVPTISAAFGISLFSYVAKIG